MIRGGSPVHISEVLRDILSQAGKGKPSVPSFSSTIPPAPKQLLAWFPSGKSLEEDEPYARVWRKFSLLDLPSKEYVYRYLLDKQRRNCKVLTLQAALNCLKVFFTFLEGIGKSGLEELTRADLEAFVEHEQDRGMKLSSIHTYLAHIYAFLDFLIQEEIVAAEVLRRRVRLRLPQSLPRAMEPDDVRQLLCVIGHIRDRAMILVLLRTGMRIGELLTAKVSDVNVKERTITIWEGVKNRRGRVVYFSDDARDALNKWLKLREARGPYPFYGRSGGRLSYNGARLMFKRNLDKAGLAHKSYTLHCLRHTFASEMLNAGMRLECLQPLLGHDNIEMTRRYARLTNKTRRQEYFRAMAVIERGEIDDSYQLNRELQTILKEKKLCTSHDKELSPQS